jgi:hypothetical protein
LQRIQPENDADSAHIDWLIEQSNEAKKEIGTGKLTLEWQSSTTSF